MKRLIVDVYDGWQGINFKPVRIADVHEIEGEGWPRKNARAVIRLAVEGSDEDALEQVRLWLAAGRPDPKEAKEASP